MSELCPDVQWRSLYESIGQVLFDNQLEPTPSHYGLAHRYFTGSDASFNGTIDRAIAGGGLSSAAAAAIMAERNVELSAADLHGMAAEAQAKLASLETVIAASRTDHERYGRALATNAAELVSAGTSAPVVDSLIGVTQAMIGKSRGVEEQLRTACAEIRQLRDSLAEAQEAANRDALTGLPNRRALDARLTAACEAARADGRPFSIAICDIDHFKAFNDRWGHQVGDEVIKFVAVRLTRDDGDRLFAARYGGEEFVVLFEGADARAAGREIDRIRAAIAARELRINATGQTLGQLTFSAGVAQLGETDEGASSMLKRADLALYEAKGSGRNRVVVG